MLLLAGTKESCVPEFRFSVAEAASASDWTKSVSWISAHDPDIRLTNIHADQQTWNYSRSVLCTIMDLSVHPLHALPGWLASGQGMRQGNVFRPMNF